MRTLLLALCMVIATSLARPLAAQMVEESLSQDPGPLDFIQGDSYAQWILQSLAGDALVGIAADGHVVPRLASHWETRKDGTIIFSLRSNAHFTNGVSVSTEEEAFACPRSPSRMGGSGASPLVRDYNNEGISCIRLISSKQ